MYIQQRKWRWNIAWREKSWRQMWQDIALWRKTSSLLILINRFFFYSWISSPGIVRLGKWRLAHLHFYFCLTTDERTRTSLWKARILSSSISIRLYISYSKTHCNCLILLALTEILTLPLSRKSLHKPMFGMPYLLAKLHLTLKVFIYLFND